MTPSYNQSGFKLDKKGGQAVLSLSKLGDIPIRLHRAIPDGAKLKQVTLKKEATGEWFATFGVQIDHEPPEPPEDPEKCVGIDVGILTYAHDTDGTAVGSLDLSDERERLEREQRDLSRKEHGSNNYEKQRRRVAECHADLRRKRRDFLHKLSNYYARKYDLVAVEDLNVKGMMESPSNSRNTASAAWRTFLSLLQYKCDREGTHFVAVNPRGTTKECASCGVSTDKPLWVREHSCPSCGFEADRDANAVVRLRLTGSKIAQRFCDGVEYSFSRSRRHRSGTLRINACGDCAPCGYHSGVCKARRGSRKPHPQGANRASGE
ncbi:Transposable element, IS605 OrfB family [Halomicrobium sp. LC1Hm]|nr:Transposable element, IS605 OrfB family [Halomicrobium sp. LC1Hm]